MWSEEQVQICRVLATPILDSKALNKVLSFSLEWLMCPNHPSALQPAQPSPVRTGKPRLHVITCIILCLNLRPGFCHQAIASYSQSHLFKRSEASSVIMEVTGNCFLPSWSHSFTITTEDQAAGKGNEWMEKKQPESINSILLCIPSGINFQFVRVSCC